MAGVRRAENCRGVKNHNSRVTLKCNGEFIYTPPLYLSLAAEKRLPPLVSVSLRFPALDPPPSRRAAGRKFFAVVSFLADIHTQTTRLSLQHASSPTHRMLSLSAPRRGRSAEAELEHERLQLPAMGQAAVGRVGG